MLIAVREIKRWEGKRAARQWMEVCPGYAEHRLRVHSDTMVSLASAVIHIAGKGAR
jgi:hypothetical protein